MRTRPWRRALEGVVVVDVVTLPLPFARDGPHAAVRCEHARICA